MSNHLNTAEQYRQWVEQCVAMAKAATSNKMRAHHYATALNYLKLADEAAYLVEQRNSLMVPASFAPIKR